MITYPSKSELKTASEVAVYFRNCSDGKQMESKWKANVFAQLLCCSDDGAIILRHYFKVDLP